MDTYRDISNAIEQALDAPIFFIVGFGKSGTTWLQHLLDGHPDISCRGEGHFFSELLPRVQNALVDYSKNISFRNTTMGEQAAAYPLLQEKHLRFILASIMGLLLHEQAGGQKVKWIGEKTPANIDFMAQIRENFFPQACFIHIIRDGRDATVSAWYHALKINERVTLEKHQNFQNFVGFAAEHWQSKIRKAREFAGAHPEAYCEIRYEQLHADFGGELARVLEFLAVDADPKAIAACREAGAFGRLSGGRERGEENREAFFRKGVVGDWRNTFDAECERIFTDKAGGLLEELEYDDATR